MGRDGIGHRRQLQVTGLQVALGKKYLQGKE